MSAVPSLDYAALYRERAITSVTANTRDDGRELFAEAGRVGVRPTITTFPLESANAALQALKAGAFAGSGVLLTGV
jgi:propanol-preferring alcohol dehydrogenase